MSNIKKNKVKTCIKLGGTKVPKTPSSQNAGHIKAGHEVVGFQTRTEILRTFDDLTNVI